MSDPLTSPTRRAARLLRCYPPGWRARYGEEFAELLIADISERPRSLRRTLDVARSGALARLAGAGLTGEGLEPQQQIRAGLTWLCGALAAFLALGVAIWSQLTVGWQWSSPSVPATGVGMILMTTALLGLLVLAVLATIPIAWTLGWNVLRGEGRGLLLPLAVAIVGAAVFTVGSIHFGHAWPGTGGHAWADRGLVPGAVARFCWAGTLWVSSYWAHPGALSAFPAAEIVWMATSPLVLLAAAVGAMKTLRRTRVAPAVLRYESWLACAAAAAMAAFLAGAGSWVVSGGPAPRALFRVGAIDAVALAGMTVALALAFRAVQRTLAARPDGRAKR